MDTYRPDGNAFPYMEPSGNLEEGHLTAVLRHQSQGMEHLALFRTVSNRFGSHKLSISQKTSHCLTPALPARNNVYSFCLLEFKVKLKVEVIPDTMIDAQNLEH